MRHLLLASALAATPLAAPAHPHLFVDAKVEVVVQNGAVAGIRLTWVYDEFFSLLLTEDLGIDDDLDGTLTPEELTILGGMVLAWPENFEGDLYLEAGGRALPLGPRQQHQVDFVNGQVIETHIRPLATPTSDPFTLRVYDPGYYTAYTVTEVRTLGGSCDTPIARADLIAATEKVDELLYAMPQDQAEIAFPTVGIEFADTISVTCAL